VIRLVDSHCHLQVERLGGETARLMERAVAAGVVTTLIPGVDLELSISGQRLAHEFGLWFSAGTHPCDTAKHDEAGIRALLCDPRCVAVGETGFDFYHKPYDAAQQESVFRSQIRMGLETQLPLVIHNRDSDRDTIRVLRDEGNPGGVFHCFGGDRQCLEEALELGFYISFAGNVTYPKALFREFVPLVPADRILVETDAPWLAPVPHRGKQNEPAHALHVLLELARLRGQDPAELGQCSIDNFCRCFPKVRLT
jgi:TatD DNase family protein